MTESVNTIFSNALLLLAVYFWYDTFKLLISQHFDSENVVVLIVISTVITLIVYFWVTQLSKTPSDPHNLVNDVVNGPPPSVFAGKVKEVVMEDKKDSAVVKKK